MVPRFIGRSLVPPKLKRIVLLNKMTRWESLVKEAGGDHKLLSFMEAQFPGMVETHRIHSASVEHIINELRNVYKVEVEVIKAQSSCCVRTVGLDAIISAGGDGTFLEAASLVTFTPLPCPATGQHYSFTACVTVPPHDKTTMESYDNSIQDRSDKSDFSRRPLWVFGVNTDPTRSEGRLLMKTDSQASLVLNSPPEIYESNSLNDSKNKDNDPSSSSNSLGKSNSIPTLRLKDIASHTESLSQIIKRLAEGNYTPIQRRRLRVSIVDNYITPLKDYHHVAVGEKLRRKYLSRSTGSIAVSSNDGPVASLDSQQPNVTSKANDEFSKKVEQEKQNFYSLPNNLSHTEDNYKLKTNTKQDSFSSSSSSSIHLLDYRAVNDIFLTNLQSNLTLYVEVKVDDEPSFRSKNSGILICSGSGSTAWAFNISKISEENVKTITDSFIKYIPSSVLRTMELPTAQQLTDIANSSFIFGPEEPLLRYVIREPIDNRVFRNSRSSAFCRRIQLTPLTVNSCIYLDGISSIPVSYGQTIRIEIGHEEDCLLTAI